MTDQRGPSAAEITVNLANLHREEVFTDLQSASIRRLTPVKSDGSTDSARDVLYIGETNLMTQMGPLPVQFPIEAKDLDDALSQFADGVIQPTLPLQGIAQIVVRSGEIRIDP